MKCNNARVQIVLGVIALFGVTGTAAAADALPFKGALEGSYRVTSVDLPYVYILLTASGEATQLGRFTTVFESTVDFSTANPREGWGTYTFTAANGDTLVADSFGYGWQFAPNVLYIEDTLTIVGGTGRFADASGELVIKRWANQVNLTTIGSFEGTIFIVNGDE